MMKLQTTCDECARVFDMLNADDVAEWEAGHDCEVLTAAEKVAELFARVPLPTYAETVAAAAPEHWSVAAVRTATANAVAMVASLDGATAGDDGMPWSLDLWPNRVTAEHTLDDWDAVAGRW